MSGPTPRAEWVTVGDRCISQAGMTGVVLKVIPIRSLVDVRVRWENGHVGRVRITAVRKIA